MSDRPSQHGDEERDDTIIAVALKRSGQVLLLLTVVALAIWLFNREQKAAPPKLASTVVSAPDELHQQTSGRAALTFKALELPEFVHYTGARGEKLLPETMGGGVAVFDYDDDGHQDLFFVNGCAWPHERQSDRPTQALFRNDGSGRFRDVTAEAGLALTFYGMGVACGDVDGDGDVDLFVSAVGRNHLFRNERGKFTDVTAKYGVAGADDAWSSSVGFFDYDLDGDLDLFVCNYVQWNRARDLSLNFTLNGRDRAYGPPKQYEGTDSYLYRNDGARFTDVSAEAGIHVANPATGKPMGKALALTFADPDRDGLLDIFVANDTVQNFLFRNLGQGRFAEQGVQSGIAFDGMGAATGAMGIDAGAVSVGMPLAVAIANFANESTSLYVQQPRDPWQFADMTNSQGIGSPSRIRLSFGLYFFDVDLDGRLDLLQSNGHLEERIAEVQPSQQYRQAPQLFWNRGQEGEAAYALVPEAETGDLSEAIVGRGAAYGDFDGDGDLDLVLAQLGGKPRLLRNEQVTGHHWLRVKLVGSRANRDGIGAEISLELGDKTLRRMVMPTRSYLSQVELPVTFGLDTHTRVDQLTVRWPGGEVRTYPVEAVDRLITLTE